MLLKTTTTLDLETAGNEERQGEGGGGMLLINHVRVEARTLPLVARSSQGGNWGAIGKGKFIGKSTATIISFML